MYPVFLNSTNEPHSFQTFYQKFMQICNSHKTSGSALAFAFILYDFENPQIAKVLKDTDYWLSLDHISGKYLTVFSLHHKPKVRYKPRNRRSSGNSMEYLISTSTFNNPSDDSNLLIEKYFGPTLEITYPSVLFFQIDDDKVLDYTLVHLDEQNIESSFLELKGYIQEAVNALKKITEENKGNSKEIFDLIEGNVKSLRSSKVAKRVTKKLTSIGELASTVISLKG